ncbi:hypothetical protein H312_02293 [Anncaliia algerae PRA339]|uniref:Uncharacterized protein n=1 Tax=Anncaliia algerae PRA339 TaxID=1288291 RepID=A0A059EZH2_9MICR|nr:hypothetical protein H312_02293 [Anncaliia algerae PRA339]
MLLIERIKYLNYSIPIITMILGFSFMNSEEKNTNKSLESLFLPITSLTFVINFLEIFLSKTKESYLATKPVIFFSAFFGVIDNLIFYTINHILLKQPIMIIFHSLILSMILILLMFSLPNDLVSTFLGLTIATFFYISNLSDTHLRGICISRFSDDLLIIPKVDVYFILLTTLLILRIYFTRRSEITSNLLPLYNSFFSFLCSFILFLFLEKCYFNFKNFISFVLLAFSYLVFLRIQENKRFIINLSLSLGIFSLIYFIFISIFNANLLEKHLIYYHSVIFLEIFLMIYSSINFTQRRISFTVWIVEFMGI